MEQPTQSNNLNDNGQKHGYWERYYRYGTLLFYKCYYVNDEENGYEEYYTYNINDEISQFELLFHL